MPPKTVKVPVERAGGRKLSAAPKGYIGATYDLLTSPEYSSVVRSIGAFGVGVAFLLSPYAEVLLPQ